MIKKGLFYRVAVGYVVLLHGLLLRPAVDIVKPILGRTEFTDYYGKMTTAYRRVSSHIPEGSVVFIGDSIIQGMCVAAVAPSSVNLGIGADTTQGVLVRINQYEKALAKARAVVVLIGVNDYKYRSVDAAIANYRMILGKIPTGPAVVISSLLPVDETANSRLLDRNQFIEQFNQSLQGLARKDPRVTYLDNTSRFIDSHGRLDATLHGGDGIHLSQDGYERLAAQLQSALEKAGAEKA